MRAHDPPSDLPLLLRLSDGVLLISFPQHLEVVFQFLLVQLIRRLHLLKLLLQNLESFNYIIYSHNSMQLSKYDLYPPIRQHHEQI